MPRTVERAWRPSVQAWASTVRQAGSAILEASAKIAAAVRLAATGMLLRVETAVLAAAVRLDDLKTRSARLAGGARQRLRRATAAAAGAFHRPRVSFRMSAVAVAGLALIVGTWLVVDQVDYSPAEPRDVAGVFTPPSPNPLPRGERAYTGADPKKEPSPLAGEGRVRGWRDRQTPFTPEPSPHIPPAPRWYGEAEPEAIAPAPVPEAAPQLPDDAESQIALQWFGGPEDEPAAIAPAPPAAIVPAPRPKPAAPELALIPTPDPSRPPPWLANAVQTNPFDSGRPMIAIVIDDVGVAQERSAAIIELPPPLTMAIIPYGKNLDVHTRRARERGHEILLHIPMEPSSADADPGPNALLTGLGQAEIMRRVKWGMGRIEGYVGVSNHMGSLFMEREDMVKPVLSLVRERGLMFLDSRTTAGSVGAGLARDMGVPNASRDVFLDNEQTLESVREQLAKLERIARRQGYAVGIGHPHDVTREALAEWLPAARKRGIVFVPITAIVKHLRQRPTTVAGQG